MYRLGYKLNKIMEIKEFVEKATKGGWLYQGDKPFFDEVYGHWYVSDADGGYVCPSIEVFFLDPKFWQAVGKVKGWDYEVDYKDEEFTHYKPNKGDWKWQMHQMIDALAEGKTVEEFIKTL